MCKIAGCLPTELLRRIDLLEFNVNAAIVLQGYMEEKELEMEMLAAVLKPKTPR